MPRFRALLCVVLSVLFVLSTAMGASAPAVGTVTSALGAHVGAASATVGATVFVWNEIDEMKARAMANLPDLEVRTPGSLRLVDVLESDTLLVMRPALDALAARGRVPHAQTREAAARENAASATREPVTA